MPNDIKIVSHTQEAVDAKDEAIERAMVNIGIKMEKYAKASCPTGSPETTGIKGYIGGTLKNSITYVTATHPGGTISVEEGKASPTKPMHGGKKETASTDEKEVVYVGTNVFYAPYVEFGFTSKKGRKKEPRPFIKPALKDHMALYDHIMRNELKKVKV